MNQTILSNEYNNYINSGPYDFTMFFENKEYPHSVNLVKLKFTYKINNQNKTKILFLSTGHSFAEKCYKTDNKTNLKIVKTNNIQDIFNPCQNVFFSIDNGFDDFCLLSFCNDKNIIPLNYLPFNKYYYKISSICKNMDIKFLENELLIKNGHNTGESISRAIINFDSDVYILYFQN